MVYVELLRLRRAFTIYGSIVGGLFLFALIASHWPGNELHAEGGPRFLPLSALMFGAMYCAIIFATVISPSLNRENDGVEMVWTKPIARERLALLYMLCDLATVVVAFAFALSLMLLWLASVGLLRLVAVDASVLPVLAVGLGTAFMWYGLLQALTSWQLGNCGIVVGVSWGLAFVLIGFGAGTQAHPSLHAFFMALNFLNPLAYFTSYVMHLRTPGSPEVSALIPVDAWGRAALTWSFGILGCAGAIVGWKRLEV